MLIRFFEKLRQRSEIERKQYALVISFLCTGAIFAVWLGFITSDFSKNGFFDESQIPMTPFQSITRDVASVGSAIKDNLNFFKPEVYQALPKDVSATGSN